MMLRFDDAIGGGGAASECACDAGAANGARGGRDGSREKQGENGGGFNWKGK